MARRRASKSGARSSLPAVAKPLPRLDADAAAADLLPLLSELVRLHWLSSLEERLYDLGCLGVAGVDEAGRGCLAGPVVAAAVIPEPGCRVPGVDDSKKLDATTRERLYAAITTAHPRHGVAAVSPQDIDRVNILEATRLAMRQALSSLEPAPDAVLIDAVPLASRSYRSLAVVRGDGLSYAIACASILAKVHRDRLMVQLDRHYPQYDFAANKGYGAPRHLQALSFHGPCVAHRLTFASVLPRTEASIATRAARRRRRAARRRVGSNGWH